MPSRSRSRRRSKKGEALTGRRRGHTEVATPAAVVLVRNQAMPPLEIFCPEKKPGRITVNMAAEDLQPMELDLHGRTVAEAEPMLMRFLDSALLRGLKRFRVIHGKGSGRLSRAVRRILAAQPAVATYYFADVWSGSYGATEVVLK